MATNNNLVSASTMALSMNERFSALKSEALKGALLIIGKAQDKAGMTKRESALVVGHAIHDITAGKAYKADGFKNAAEAVNSFFTEYSEGRANQLAKLWENWGDFSKLSETDKAIYQAGTSPEALITLNQLTEAQRAEEVKNKATPYFTAAEAKAARDKYKEPKTKVLKLWAVCCPRNGVTEWKQWGEVHPEHGSPDSPEEGAYVVKTKSGDYIYSVPIRSADGDDDVYYYSYTLREIKSEKKSKSAPTSADVLKNMTAEQKRSLIDELMKSLEE